MTIPTTIKNTVRSIFNFLFPQRCVGCEKEDEVLCEKCVSDILADGFVKDESAFSLLDYKNPITKKIIWNIKYGGDMGLSQIVGEILYNGSLEYISEEMSYFPSSEKPLIIPIPVSPKRARVIGFNHAESIAKYFCDLAGDTFLFENSILIKIKENEAQAKIENRQKRFENVAGVFGIKNPEKISGRMVILLDDVRTTGATLLEASRLLQESGAGKVVCVTVARG